MKRILLITLISITQFHFANGQTEKTIRPDSMNLGIVIVDYLTYQYKKACINYYPLCRGCDSLNLPFEIINFNGGDYTSKRFRYSYDDTTLFYASIIWMGTGEIYFPKNFSDSGSIKYISDTARLKENISHFSSRLLPYDSIKYLDYLQKLDTAWNSIRTTRIVNNFDRFDYQLGVYIYTPTVGMIDPSKAKWVFFFYYNSDFSSSIEDPTSSNGITIFPNPTQSTMTVQFANNISVYGFQIINQMGQIAHSGELFENQIDINDLKNGLYYVHFYNDQNEIVEVKKIIKNAP